MYLVGNGCFQQFKLAGPWKQFVDIAANISSRKEEKEDYEVHSRCEMFSRLNLYPQPLNVMMLSDRTELKLISRYAETRYK